MKLTLPRATRDGLTLLEVLVLIAVVTVLGFVFVLPIRFVTRCHPATPANVASACAFNLREIAFSEMTWAYDHGGGNHIPWAVPASQGGLRERLVEQKDLIGYYQRISTDRLLIMRLKCPSDGIGRPASSFETMKPSDLSYFMNLDATPMELKTVLRGDADFSIVGSRTRARDKVMTLTRGSEIAWGKRLHLNSNPPQGNVAHADGSVSSELYSAGLKAALFPPENGPKEVRLLFP